MQSQNQACQTSAGDKTGEEREGQQGRLLQGHWSKRKAKENEAAVSSWQRIQKRLNCSVPSLSQSLLTRFSLRPSSSNWLVAESRGCVLTHSKQKLNCRPLKQTEHNTSPRDWVGHIRGAEGAGCHCHTVTFCHLWQVVAVREVPGDWVKKDVTHVQEGQEGESRKLQVCCPITCSLLLSKKSIQNLIKLALIFRS